MIARDCVDVCFLLTQFRRKAPTDDTFRMEQLALCVGVGLGGVLCREPIGRAPPTHLPARMCSLLCCTAIWTLCVFLDISWDFRCSLFCFCSPFGLSCSFLLHWHMSARLYNRCVALWLVFMVHFTSGQCIRVVSSGSTVSRCFGQILFKKVCLQQGLARTFQCFYSGLHVRFSTSRIFSCALVFSHTCLQSDL